MKNLIKLLILLTTIATSLYADKNIGTYCFESPYIFMRDGTKIKKVVVHFEDSNHSKEYRPLRMFYFLENDNRRYSVPDLFVTYDNETNVYEGGIECDGGSLKFNATNNRLSMEDIRLSGACGEITPPLGFEVEEVKLDDSLEDIVKISNAQEGWMGIGFLNKKKQIDYSKEKLWIKGEKCTDSEDIEASKIFYTEKEYIERKNSSRIEDEYAHYFDEPFGERKELDETIETIYLEKSYTNIADMMQEEGFNSKWMKPYTIRFFLYNNKRALIHIESTDTSDKSQFVCFCSSYYLLELHQNILKKMSFGLECGEFSKVVIFEKEPIGVKKHD